MQSGVVLDRYFSDLLLQMAFSEGLLVADHLRSDGLYRRINEYPQIIDIPSRTLLFENIIMNKFLYCEQFAADALSGPLVDNGFVKFLPRVEGSDLDQYPRFSLQFLMSGLRARGLKINEKDIIESAFGILELENKITKAHGTVPPLASDGRLIFEALYRAAGIFSSYNKVDFQNFELLSKYRQIISPAANLFDDFMRVQFHSENQGARVLLHLGQGKVLTPSGPQDFIFNRDQTLSSISEGRSIRIFRMASKKLGRIPVRDTLRENLELTQKPETEDFRSRVNDWASAISTSEFDDALRIQRDIETAQKWLRNTESVSTAAGILGFVAAGNLGASQWAPSIALEGLQVVDATITVLGFLSFASAEAVKRRYRWMMFG